MSCKPLKNGKLITLIGWPTEDHNQVFEVVWADVEAMMLRWRGDLLGGRLFNFGLSSEGTLWARGGDISSEDLRAALTAQALARGF